MSCSIEDIIAAAREEIGVTENPSGSNKVKYNTDYYGKAVSGAAYPWCCVFIWWLFKQCGGSMLFFAGGKTASCTAVMNYAKKNDMWVTSDYRAGDLILFNFDDDGSPDHIGICESASDDFVTCIEGNTSNTSNDNGGAVMRRTRSVSFVLGAYRPQYKNSPYSGKSVSVCLPMLSKGSSGNSVKALQMLLNGHGFGCGAVDGIAGKNTISAIKSFQAAKKLEVDGIVGVNTWTGLLS